MGSTNLVGVYHKEVYFWEGEGRTLHQMYKYTNALLVSLNVHGIRQNSERTEDIFCRLNN